VERDREREVCAAQRLAELPHHEPEALERGWVGWVPDIGIDVDSVKPTVGCEGYEIFGEGLARCLLAAHVPEELRAPSAADAEHELNSSGSLCCLRGRKPRRIRRPGIRGHDAPIDTNLEVSL
jgi:hypothetical protein